MDGQELRDLCLAFRGSNETFPFGPQPSVFKVAGKMFALARLDGDPLSMSVKCEPALAEQLRAAHPAVTPGHHLNKRHWNTVLIDGSLPDEMIADMIEDSYDLVVSKLSKARRHALGEVCLSQSHRSGSESVHIGGAPAFGFGLLDLMVCDRRRRGSLISGSPRL